ncbi:TetR/AcrR family transcriptional regulator [Aestuariivirga sp.]|jgi:AcrR family transcriptional regulator|uniref:TetR/AcrR family transcriptional regulator n=1 Tax=Aestuariivirga sp. TaxID=2650926 RepID=UPI0037835F27
MSIRREAELRKKEKTVATIVEATELLVSDGSDSLPTAREIAKKSGYSIGSLYSNFTSVGDIVAQIVARRQVATATAVEALLVQHAADDGVDVFCSKLTVLLFSLAQAFNPKVVRFVFNVALDHSRRTDILNIAADRMVSPLMAAIARDRSGTFKKLSEKELRPVVTWHRVHGPLSTS